MSATSEAVMWTKLVIVGVPGMECIVPVTPDGRVMDADGEPLPMSERTSPCGAAGAWTVGACFVCAEHAAMVAGLMGDSIEEIDAAWRAAR